MDENEVQVHHCVSRCVRQAWLCGDDPLTGVNHDHRRDWIEDRLAELAGIFAIDLGFFAVLSNHYHVILRTRPDLAKAWSKVEVARCWWRLFPGRRDEHGQPAEPTDAELNLLMHDAERLEQLRKRLASLSWLMRCLNEHIARQANAEDQKMGRFWEGRFKNQRLDTLSALLLCAMYVDLNLVRAGLAKTPEESRHTSVYLRIRAAAITPTQPQPDAWLAPFTLAEHPPPDDAPKMSPGARASNRGLLPLSLAQYLELLDGLGRQRAVGKRGAIPAELAGLPVRQNRRQLARKSA